MPPIYWAFTSHTAQDDDFQASCMASEVEGLTPEMFCNTLSTLFPRNPHGTDRQSTHR